MDKRQPAKTERRSTARMGEPNQRRRRTGAKHPAITVADAASGTRRLTTNAGRKRRRIQGPTARRAAGIRRRETSY